MFSSVPIPSIVVFKISPSFRNLPWVAPTPSGVPVKITSPVFKVINSDMYEIKYGISNIKSLVSVSCLNSSFTQHWSFKDSLLSNKSVDTKYGPIGPKVSNDLP